MLQLGSLSAFGPRPIARSTVRRSTSHNVVLAAYKSTGVTKGDVKSADGGRMVVQLDDQKILLTVVEDTVYATSNKCSHLGLPLVGKTALMQGEIKGQCIVCPAHGTQFNVTDGSVQGEWCPKMPNLPLVGKMGDPKPLPTFKSTVDETTGMISVDL